jgi:hypothetical protein
MKLNLTELSKAVSAVAGIAAERSALIADAKASQDAVDTLTASLLAATSSPAEAVGIAAVAAALADEPAVVGPVMEDPN